MDVIFFDCSKSFNRCWCLRSYKASTNVNIVMTHKEMKCCGRIFGKVYGDTDYTLLKTDVIERCSNVDCPASSSCATLHECSACHLTKYCSKICQSVHWEQHRTACKMMRKAIKAHAMSDAMVIASKCSFGTCGCESKNN